MRRKTFLILIVLTMMVMQGCAFFKLQDELNLLASTTGIGGKLFSETPKQLPVFVVLYAEEESGSFSIVQYVLVDPQTHAWGMRVDQGDYYVIAFEDANGNFSFDAGEYFGVYGRPDRIRIPLLATRNELHITVASTAAFPVGFSTDLPVVESLKDQARMSNLQVAFGKLATLDDERFSIANASKGFWQPVSFLDDVGTGIYFLEEYDPHKIPVLFVHGAVGSPQVFTHIVEHMDRSRFQPWFFHYPSGMPLEKVSRFLNRQVSLLAKKYGFEEIYVTAHSMGGLVARSFILRNVYDDGNGYVRLLVSISTPWDGVEAAESGVKNAPTAIPSWHDVVPGSLFLSHVFERSLQPEVDFYLFFSHSGGGSMFMGNNDGSVSISSQLDMEAQEDALERWGFDEDHSSILQSRQVAARYNRILEKTYDKNPRLQFLTEP